MARGASAKRYARAAFDIAKSRGEIEQWAEQLRQMQGVLQGADLLERLEYPRLTPAMKVELIQNAFGHFNPLVVNMLSLLATQNRVRLLPQLIDEYERLADAHYGRVRAFVITAVPLEREQGERIKQQLEQMLGQQVIISASVDEGILGGVVARVGDRIIDGSLKTKLLALRSRLVESSR